MDDFLIKTPKHKKQNLQPTTIINPEKLTDHPDAVAAGIGKEDLKVSKPTDNETEKMTKKPKNRRRSPIKWFKDLSKKKKILFIVLILILISGSSVGAYFAFKKEPPKPFKKIEKKVVVKPPEPTTVASRLTGVQISKDLNKRDVTGIMIENSPDARPQSGLSVAGVVFEAIAEGGITRFLTLHQEDQPDYIGPVRSVRPYYLEWVQGFNAPIAHAGGPGFALQKIIDDGIPDFNDNAQTFFRVDSRYAPHNLYTTMDKLDELRASKGIGPSPFEGFPRKKESPSKAPTAKSIDFSISSYLYNPHYDYDVPTNSYKRSEGGEPHTDEKSGAQISPKVVIAIVMQFGILDSVGHSDYNAIGNGKCYVFQDGIVTEGNWEKTSSKAQITFKDAAGKTIPLNPGQTWISAVNGADKVTYTP